VLAAQGLSRGASRVAPIGTWEAKVMAAVRTIIDTVNELAQAPLRASSRVWGGRQAGLSGRLDAKRAMPARAATESPPLDVRYAHGNVEPPLEEVLGDPIVHLVMRADRLDPADVRRSLRP
jgi:hypothetical protein